MAYPVILLCSWILEALLENIEVRSAYVSDVLKKRFLQYRGPGACNIKYTPLVRIFKFTHATANGELVAVVNDSTHKIVVLFTRQAVRKFEVKYGQRITYKSEHSLVILQRADLRFVSLQNHKHFTSTLRELCPSDMKGNSVLFLEVAEVEFFSRDQHTVPMSYEQKLRFVYIEPEYQRRFMVGKGQKQLPCEGVKEHSDGYHDMEADEMVSEAEESFEDT